MKALSTGIVAIAAVALLAACSTSGTPSSAPPTSSTLPTTTSAAPTTTTKPPAIADHGIVVAFCLSGANSPMSVVSILADHRITPGHNFDGSFTSDEWQGGLCSSPGGPNFDSGRMLRSRFNGDFTAVLTTKTVPGTSNSPSTVGWYGDLDAVGADKAYTQLSPPSSSDLVRQADINPMYDVTTQRVYYWDNSKAATDQDPVLMSCTAFGAGTRPEPDLGKEYPYIPPQTSVHGFMYMPGTTAPVIVDTKNDQVLNRAGTKAFSVFDQKLEVMTPGKLDGGQGTPIAGKFHGTLRISSFGADDSTVILRDDYQVYRATVTGDNTLTGITPLFNNDQLQIWDPTVSADGQSVALLANDGQKTRVYNVKVDGSTANSPDLLYTLNTPFTANILAFP